MSSSIESGFLRHLVVARWKRKPRFTAKTLPPAPLKDETLKMARRLEIASHINDWLNSRELMPPKQ